MRLANRMKHMESKELLSLMELVDATDIISFSGGFPSPETYPIEDIKESFIKVLENEGKEALSYSSTSGYGRLRELVAERMESNFGTKFQADEIIMTSGSQQALDMSGLLLIDKDDIILFETPSYLGALNALKAYEAKLVAVPTDDDGIKIDALKEALDIYGDRVKLIYVIPDFQNPTSRCWSLERRKAFMELMNNYEVAVLEDAAYSELSFRDHKEKPLIGFDQKDR
jgi:2-aminoadipate transaminase